MTQKANQPTNPTGRELDDPRATAYERVPEGEVPPFPESNPRNATDQTGMPRNPAVSHPLDSKGFPDNDGDMAPAPVDQEIVHPDGDKYVIHHAGVVKPEDIPDSELPPEQRADEDYRTKYERDHPEAKAEDVSEPRGQPKDKYGFDLRKGADPDAQSTGDYNPDNPDRVTISDRYLGEEEPLDDGTSTRGNAEDSANDGLGFPKAEGPADDQPFLQPGAGGGGSTETGLRTGQFSDPYDPTQPPVTRETTTIEKVEDEPPPADETGPEDGTIRSRDTRAHGSRRDYGKGKK